MSGQGDVPNPEAWVQGPLLSGVPDLALDAIDLTWTLPATGYPGASSLSIYRADSGGSFAALVTGLPLSQTTYQDTAVVSTHYYSYYIAVTYGVGGPVVSNVLTLFGEIDDIFLANGTWTKRSGLKSAQIIAIGPGGGGQGGYATLVGGSACEGCGGGGGGGYASATVPAANLPATAPVVVGTGGLGGAQNSLSYGTTANSVIPTTSAAGSRSTTFNGTWLVANPGSGATGSSGAATGGTANVIGTIGATNIVTETGGAGGIGSSGALDDFPRFGGTTTLGAGAGGAGGGCSNAPTQDLGAGPGNTQNGGASPAAVAGAGSAGVGHTNSGTNATATAAGAGGNGTLDLAGGGGGGGGCAIANFGYTNAASIGGNGGNGGTFGAGGGGGGTAESGNGGNFQFCTALSGIGGNGANGVCIVKNLFW